MSRIYQALKASTEAKHSQVSQSIDSIQTLVEPGEERSGTITRVAPGTDFSVEPHYDMRVPASNYAMVTLPLPLPAPVFPFNGGSPQAAEQYRSRA